MTAFYLLPDVFGEEALTARWWWEIVLNLQILSFAFMWFCHHNRLVLSRGRWRFRAVSHFVTGVVSVSYPVLLMLISAYMDWFRAPPPQSQVYTLIFAGTALWAVGTFVMPILHWLVVRHETDGQVKPVLGTGSKTWLQTYWPTIVGLVVAGVEIERGGLVGFTLLPMLMYLQGALPYFAKSQHASARDSEF